MHVRNPVAGGTLVVLLLAFVASGCRHPRPVNPPLTEETGAPRYYFHTRERPDNSPDTMFVVCFSGGGTRASALSCGVLEELARTVVPGLPRRMLDEVDAISAVSGGSVTAAAYALYGDEALGRLETNFLRQDIQGVLFWRFLNPFRWGKLWSPHYNRSDLAADYYDEVLFHGATFADLAARPGAFVVMNATDISTGTRFGFSQYQFDLLCADLAPLRVSRAVAASSAVPGLLTPITLNNYAGQCPPALPASLLKAARGQSTNVTGRALHQLQEVSRYLDTNRPFLHLMDGGVSDNLGIRAVLDGIYALDHSPEARARVDLSRLRRVAILCVNAHSNPDTEWDQHEAPPGTLTLAVAASGIPMNRYSYETIQLLKQEVTAWRDRAQRDRGQSGGPPVEFFPIIVSFDQLQDAEERRFFLNQPTSFRLPAKDVDALREVGGRLLRGSAEYQAFVKDFAAP